MKFVFFLLACSTIKLVSGNVIGMKYTDLLPSLGLNKTNIPSELKNIIKSMIVRKELRTKEEFEVDPAELRKQLQTIKEQILEFLTKGSFLMNIDTIIEAMTSVFERALHMAPIQDWAEIYRIYKENPELIKSFASAQNYQIFEMARIAYGNTEALETAIESFTMFSDLVGTAGKIAQDMLESRLEQEFQRKDKEAEEKRKAKAKAKLESQEKTEL